MRVVEVGRCPAAHSPPPSLLTPSLPHSHTHSVVGSCNKHTGHCITAITAPLLTPHSSLFPSCSLFHSSLTTHDIQSPSYHSLTHSLNTHSHVSTSERRAQWESLPDHSITHSLTHSLTHSYTPAPCTAHSQGVDEWTPARSE